MALKQSTLGTDLRKYLDRCVSGSDPGMCTTFLIVVRMDVIDQCDNCLPSSVIMCDRCASGVELFVISRVCRSVS